jgi:hypothetical protein
MPKQVKINEKLIALLVTLIAVWQVSITGDQTKADPAKGERCFLHFLDPSPCTRGKWARQNLYALAIGSAVWIVQSRKKE